MLQPLCAILTNFIIPRPDKIYGLEIPYDKPIEEHVQLTKYEPPACWIAGGESYVSFTAKPKLIDHHIESLSAAHFRGYLMIITTPIALKLINEYY